MAEDTPDEQFDMEKDRRIGRGIKRIRFHSVSMIKFARGSSTHRKFKAFLFKLDKLWMCLERLKPAENNGSGQNSQTR